tara:strand:- start:1917 stop:2960 length:1044 start_codon:yes stop_codon:yes gene_type:complete
MKLSTAREITLASIRHNLKVASQGGSSSQYVVPYYVSSVGIGKTTDLQFCAKLMAEELGNPDFGCEVVIVADRDIADMSGFPNPDFENGTFSRLRPDYLPTEGQGVLILDELGQADVSKLNIVSRLVNERRIGEHKLGDGWTVVCAGNHVKHRAGSNALPTQLRDRLLHLEIEADIDDSVDYFNKVGVNPAITGYLYHRPSALCEFDKNADVCPSPRAWHKASEILGFGLSEMAEYEALRGTVGDGQAAGFKAFLRIFREVPDPKALLNDPANAVIPSEPSVLFAVCAAIAQYVNKDNADGFFAYISRLPQQEFAAFAIKSVYARWPEIKHEKSFKAWFKEHGKALA